MILNNMSNLTRNISNDSFDYMLEHCKTPQSLSWTEFLDCYSILSRYEMFRSIFGFCVAISSFSLNLLVIVMIYAKPVHLTIFDKILIGHCIVNGLTGLIDIPIFHIYTFFGYWPFHSFFCYFFASYDNNINTTTSLHMFYITYVRVRSIQAPKTYNKELLMRRPEAVMACIWAFGLGVWTPIILSFGIKDFSCEVNIEMEFLVPLLNILLWFTPLFSILITALVLISLLRKNSQRKSHVSAHKHEASMYQQSRIPTRTMSFSHTNGTLSSLRAQLNERMKSFRLGAQSKFMIIVSFVEIFLSK